MKDLFSDDSLRYKQARPAYSAEIVQEILKHVPERTFAWDCGAGSGQFTQLLVPHFQQILATDLSQAQLDLAPQWANVSYRICLAQDSGLWFLACCPCVWPSGSLNVWPYCVAFSWT